MTSARQFFGTFNRATFYDVECIFTQNLHTARGGSLTFVCERLGRLLGFMVSQVIENKIGASHFVEGYSIERNWVNGQRKQISGEQPMRTYAYIQETAVRSS